MLTKEENAVYSIIANSDRITQLQISRHIGWLGCHPEHESHLNIDKQQSTLRKIRQIIRDLRIIHGIAILSDINGYWIVKNEGEAKEYISRIEKTAKAQAKAWFETYSAMKKIFNIQSEFFDKQLKLSL